MASRAEKMKLAREQMRNRENCSSDLSSFTYASLESDSPLNNIVEEIRKEYDKNQIYYFKASELNNYHDETIRLKLHTGEKREALKGSIMEDGVLDPILVWFHDNEKEILAGHNRADISRELDYDVPCIIYSNITKEQADRIVIVTNLFNRQYTEMLPSELCKMLDRLMETYSNSVFKEETYKSISDEFNLSKQQVLIYIRLKKLIPELLKMVDEGKIAVTTGYALSAVSEENQRILFNFLIEKEIKTVKGTHVEYLKKRETVKWDYDFLSIAFGLKEQKKCGVKPTSLKIPISKISTLLSEEEVKNGEEVVFESLEIRNHLKCIMEEKGISFNVDNIKHILDKIM